jgi:CTP:molybdopterin cytidylyltransferase MocA
MGLAAVITAGGRVDGEFARTIGTTVKALAPFRNSTFLDLTIAALRAAGADRIAVVGGSEVRAACEGRVERCLTESADGAENLTLALHAWDDEESLLYLTSDMPFVTGAALRAFLERAPSGTLCLPLVEWRDFVRLYPRAPPFGIALGGEKVVNGGAFLIPPYSRSKIAPAATRLFGARKNAWRMARLAGLTVLVRFACGSLRIAHLESRAQAVLGVPARALRGSPPELGYDVDVLEEYRYAIATA